MAVIDEAYRHPYALLCHYVSSHALSKILEESLLEARMQQKHAHMD
jgi:hypothetical protein